MRGKTWSPLLAMRPKKAAETKSSRDLLFQRMLELPQGELDDISYNVEAERLVFMDLASLAPVKMRLGNFLPYSAFPMPSKSQHQRRPHRLIPEGTWMLSVPQPGRSSKALVCGGTPALEVPHQSGQTGCPPTRLRCRHRGPTQNDTKVRVVRAHLWATFRNDRGS